MNTFSLKMNRGGNIGFRSAGNPIFADGEFFEETDPDIISKYRDTDGKRYDDAIMRKAVEEVKQSFDLKYRLWGNNCQDFTQSVREQFQEIIKQAN